MRCHSGALGKVTSHKTSTASIKTGQSKRNEMYEEL